MSKKTTQFLDLTDLPLLCLFEYLTIRERFQLFFDFPPCRLQPLLLKFISFVNIRDEDDQWIRKYFLEALDQQFILGLRLKEEQIDFSLSDIQRIYLTSTYLNDQVSTNDCISLSQCLKKLVLLCDEEARDKQIDNYSDSIRVDLYRRYVYPIIGQNYIFQNLVDLSIDLPGISHIFKILNHLPNLQKLKIYVREYSSCDKKGINLNNKGICKMLSNVTIIGQIEYPDLKKFFVWFGSTIQFLTLNIVISEIQSDLIEFEHDLFNNMPLLSSFNCFIGWECWSSDVSDEYLHIDIQSFQNQNWQRFGSLVSWLFNSHYSNTMMCNLPYKFRCFEITSEDLTLWYTGSEQTPPVFEGVRTVMLTDRHPWWSMKTFHFIQNSFPNLRTLYFYSILEEADHSYIESFEERFPELFSDDFLNNDQIQLLTVTTVHLDIEYNQYNNATLQCLFNLLPNLTTIKTDSLKHAQKFYNYQYSEVVENKLNSLKIEPRDIPNHFSSFSDIFYYFCEKRNN